MRRSYLYALVFIEGMVTLGAELSASRLLAPYFGTSLIVWSSLIGLILLSLAVGYWLGGVWVDRKPFPQTLFAAVVLSCVAVGLVPVAAQPILQAALKGVADIQLGLFFGSLVGVLFLMGIPMLLLGCIAPMAVRLADLGKDEAGRVSGRIFAFSTAGSFFGSFLPVLFLIPMLGTRKTFMLLSLVLLLMGLYGCWRYRVRPWLIAGLALAALLIAGLADQRGLPIKPGEHVRYETESAYQYIQVTENEQGWRKLQLNEGIVTHSKYHPFHLLTGGEWDFMALVPLFHAAPWDPFDKNLRWGFIGGGAGSSTRLITETYGAVPIDSVEIDGEIVRIGRELFGMTQTNLEVHVTDGRSWIHLATNRYDALCVDAYRQPYIPFELTTREFFQQAYDLLNPGGVVALNAGRTQADTRLLDALSETVRSVFPSVWVMDLPHMHNAVIVGCRGEVAYEDIIANFDMVEHPVLREVIGKARRHLRVPGTGDLVFTDDKAPVERYMDLMVLGEISRM